jgi:hypothetical protein
LKVVVVGFKTTEENSVFYTKLDLETTTRIQFEAVIGHAMLSAYGKGADFVSVRYIR